MSDPSTIAAAMSAEDEARRASGLRLTYLPGPISRTAKGMTVMPCHDDPDTFDGAWELYDGVFYNRYPDVEWGHELVIERVARHLRYLSTLRRAK
jgi:hypothetical protein